MLFKSFVPRKRRPFNTSLVFKVLAVFAVSWTPAYPQVGAKWDAPASFRNLNPSTAIEFKGFPDSTVCKKPFGSFQLFKDPVSGWLLVGAANGQVWRLNEEDRWVRQDSTECVGYNGGAHVLPGPMKYGGFGIWRSFGLLLFYSWKAHEWHTIEIDRELPMTYGTAIYFDAADSSLYQVGSVAQNDGLKKPLTVNDSVFKLDLRTGQWQTLGKINSSLSEQYSLASGNGASYTVPDGVIFGKAGQRKPLYIDFKAMRCYVLSDRVSDRLWTLSDSQYAKDKRAIATDKGIYTLNHSYEIVDSASWESLLNDRLLDFPLRMPFRIAIVAISLVAAVFAFRRLRSRKNERTFVTPPSSADGVEEEEIPVQPVPGTYRLKTENGMFMLNGNPLRDLSVQERQVIQSLIGIPELRESGLSTQRFNEILGIEQRTLDSQKKTRSEVIRNINRQFNACGFPGEAVRRSRHEDDRRAVTYVLAPEIVVG
jgi:hypothetical protein